MITKRYLEFGTYVLSMSLAIGILGACDKKNSRPTKSSSPSTPTQDSSEKKDNSDQQTPIVKQDPPVQPTPTPTPTQGLPTFIKSSQPDNGETLSPYEYLTIFFRDEMDVASLNNSTLTNARRF